MQNQLDQFAVDYDGNPIGPINHASGNRRDINQQIVEAALCLNAGLPNVEKHFDERLLEQADGVRRGMTLQTMLMQAACTNGYHARPGESITDGNLRNVLAAAFQPIRASGFSTYSVPNVITTSPTKICCKVLKRWATNGTPSAK